MKLSSRPQAKCYSSIASSLLSSNAATKSSSSRNSKPSSTYLKTMLGTSATGTSAALTAQSRKRTDNSKSKNSTRTPIINSSFSRLGLVVRVSISLVLIPLSYLIQIGIRNKIFKLKIALIESGKRDLWLSSD